MQPWEAQDRDEEILVVQGSFQQPELSNARVLLGHTWVAEVLGAALKAATPANKMCFAIWKEKEVLRQGISFISPTLKTNKQNKTKTQTQNIFRS